ncbi:PAS domain S-box-containing protein/diguanylate cyclase (GGDEF)-like protein [Halanaerobium saccharolyticum]|uniref:PAS domain S-box-containing protein/diguanylate cyclase (GGDEF)-like protein n=1 Tax=Halanaerobium saccharolyticum TaxID=43595 RepID=A0A4R7Z8T8_9FIRM|nr:HD domain-containing phosphohydrolase [Halanaerobium saccharolyticum]RAK11826.1 PAS domain S-box-containing protein/diguanylate cyclase (GGDEF)-like protein [Halanaerobium saccharolyticum]TDW07667.1 PAS domain S-box-containing protein/diguanylate cyclase (GGDEF)-like protein [Halanaerobium saccharolyticum]TDX64588.1 PAS domain S-box-containing protein/diguanylate cyclase (GGDEF)-like protein [Halanaerobium saccharolyticum]
MLKIVIIINDLIEKNKMKSHLNRAKRKIADFDFELVKEFDNNRQAVNYLYQNSDVDIIIVENAMGKVFSGLDLVMLAEKEFPRSSLILLNEPGSELELDSRNVSNLTAILNKRESYSTFSNLLLLTILKQKRKNEESRKREKKLNDYRTIIDHTHDAIFLLAVDCDENFYYKRINATHQRLTALSNAEIQGKRTAEIFGEEVAEKLEKNYLRCLRKKERINYTEKLKFPAGQKYWQTTLYPVVRNGRVEEIVGASYDITDMEAKQQRLDYIKRHDRLTGLYNKEYFNQLFTELNQNQKDDLSLILLNVENFQLLNKFFSYQKGDQILKEIASVLAQISNHNKVAAHLCADHFAVILKNQSSLEVERTLNFIKKEIAQINIKGIYIDIAAVSLNKVNNKISSHDFFNDGVSKINFHRYKSSQDSSFYCSLMKYLEENNDNELRQYEELVKITKKAAAYFELNEKEKDKLLHLARHHDLGKLALDKNILKKGDSLTAEEWHEYQKHVLISANFAASYQDLAGICDLIYSHHEHFDGSGWPEGLKGEKIPYLSRLFAVINFYSKLKSNLFFSFSRDKYYFGALAEKEIVREFNHYRKKVFDPQIVDKFLSFLKIKS